MYSKILVSLFIFTERGKKCIAHCLQLQMLGLEVSVLEKDPFVKAGVYFK